MERKEARRSRRAEALTRARIIAEAIRILDEGGIDALTFRALGRSLSTGAGAIYHHVANRGELLAGATTELLAEALGEVQADEPEVGIRSVMLRVFDAIVAHPWVGTQLATAPWQPAVLTLFDQVGSELAALDVPEEAQFDAASVLVHHILGVAGQHDAAVRSAQVTMGRAAFIASATARATESVGTQHLFLERIAPYLACHDDRKQFQAGVEIILSGIATL